MSAETRPLQTLLKFDSARSIDDFIAQLPFPLERTNALHYLLISG